MKAITPSAQQVLNDSAASDWLKEALRTAVDRDPVEALNDCLLLAQVLEARLRAVFESDDA